MLPIDEINKLQHIQFTSLQAVQDEILDILILSYANGNKDAKEMLGEANKVNIDELKASVYKKTAGKDFVERLQDGSELLRLAETEANRVYNESLLNASQGIANYKQWKTMDDDKVRDPHRFLEGQKIPIDAYFYTDGDKALAPSGFSSAELNANCRCYLILSRG